MRVCLPSRFVYVFRALRTGDLAAFVFITQVLRVFRRIERDTVVVFQSPALLVYAFIPIPTHDSLLCLSTVTRQAAFEV